jgi:hypothetical protein
MYFLPKEKLQLPLNKKEQNSSDESKAKESRHVHAKREKQESRTERKIART